MQVKSKVGNLRLRKVGEGLVPSRLSGARKGLPYKNQFFIRRDRTLFCPYSLFSVYYSIPEIM